MNRISTHVWPTITVAAMLAIALGGENRATYSDGKHRGYGVMRALASSVNRSARKRVPTKFLEGWKSHE